MYNSVCIEYYLRKLVIDLHTLTVNKTNICSELRIEPWTFHYQRDHSNTASLFATGDFSSAYNYPQFRVGPKLQLFSMTYTTIMKI